jgi:hypothetical protein
LRSDAYALVRAELPVHAEVRWSGRRGGGIVAAMSHGVGKLDRPATEADWPVGMLFGDDDDEPPR